MRVRGRYLVIAWTAVFLAAVGSIVVRDAAGFALEKQLAELNADSRATQGLASDLQSQISDLQSHAVLVPRVQALGLRYAVDTEMVAIRLPRVP